MYIQQAVGAICQSKLIEQAVRASFIEPFLRFLNKCYWQTN